MAGLWVKCVTSGALPPGADPSSSPSDHHHRPHHKSFVGFSPLLTPAPPSRARAALSIHGNARSTHQEERLRSTKGASSTDATRFQAPPYHIMSSALTVDDLRAQLGSLGLSTRGRRPELRSRLRKGKSRLSPANGHSQAHYEGDEGNTAAAAADEEEEQQQEEDEEWSPQYDSYLVLDVEATCERGDPARGRGASFDFPNEIIELPVVLLQWRPTPNQNNATPVQPPTSPSALRRAASRRSGIDTAATSAAPATSSSLRNGAKHEQLRLEVIDTFHTYVKPEWRPRLTRFCRELTGIDQATVDAAPTFPVALNALRSFLSRHSLLQAPTGPRWRSASTPRYRGTSPSPTSSGIALAATGSPGPSVSAAATSYSDDVPAPALRQGVAWVTHTPHDLRDFIPKQCWISAMHTPPPFMLPAPLVDVRVAVPLVASLQQGAGPAGVGGGRGDTTIDGLLQMLRLEAFQGRRHSGLADTQNIARIVVECARRVVEAAQEHRKLREARPPTSPRAGSTSRQASTGTRVVSGEEELLRMERRRALTRVRALEESILPNTNLSKAAARRWHWMGRALGEITWLEEEERDTEPEVEEEDIFVYTRREDASRSTASASSTTGRGGKNNERMLWNSGRHSTSTSTITSSSSAGATSSSPLSRSANGNGHAAATSPTSPSHALAHAHAPPPHTPTRQTARRGGGSSSSSHSRRPPTSPRASSSRVEHSVFSTPSSSPASTHAQAQAQAQAAGGGGPYSPPPASARSPYSARSYALHQQQHAAPTSPAAHHQHAQGRTRYARGYARGPVPVAARASGTAAGTGAGATNGNGNGTRGTTTAAAQQQQQGLYGSNGAW